MFLINNSYMYKNYINKKKKQIMSMLSNLQGVRF